MDTTNEIEYELELQQRGRFNEVKKLEKAESRNYYSNTQSGRRTLQEHYAPFTELLEEQNKKELKGNITRTNISRCVLYMQSYIEVVNPLGIAAITLKTLIDSYIRQKGNVLPINIASAIGQRMDDEIDFQYIQTNTTEEIASAADSFKQAIHKAINPEITNSCEGFHESHHKPFRLNSSVRIYIKTKS